MTTGTSPIVTQAEMALQPFYMSGNARMDLR